MKKDRYQHLFFDLDHTLWDFQTNSRDTLVELFAMHRLSERIGKGVEHFLETYYKVNEAKWDLYRHGKITKTQLRHERFRDTFASYEYDDVEFSIQFEREYLDISPHRTALMPHALEVLEELNATYSLHIITNGFSEVQDVKLTKSGLKPYFDEIITSESVGINKPAAAIFVESMKRAGARRNESLMIGDNLQADILGAKNCGIDQVFYNPDSKPHSEKVTFEIRSLQELLNFL